MPVVTVMILAMSACAGGSSGQNPSTTPAAPSATVSASAAPAGIPVPPDWPADVPTVKGAPLVAVIPSQAGMVKTMLLYGTDNPTPLVRELQARLVKNGFVRIAPPKSTWMSPPEPSFLKGHEVVAVYGGDAQEGDKNFPYRQVVTESLYTPGYCIPQNNPIVAVCPQ